MRIIQIPNKFGRKPLASHLSYVLWQVPCDERTRVLFLFCSVFQGTTNQKKGSDHDFNSSRLQQRVTRTAIKVLDRLWAAIPGAVYVGDSNALNDGNLCQRQLEICIRKRNNENINNVYVECSAEKIPLQNREMVCGP